MIEELKGPSSVGILFVQFFDPVDICLQMTILFAIANVIMSNPDFVISMSLSMNPDSAGQIFRNIHS
jgi:hypothetical protein